MTKLLAFSSAIPGKPAMLPAISGKPVLLSVISGKLAMLPAISVKSAFPRQFQATKKLHPASVFSDRLLQCSFSFFSFSSVRILHPGRFHFRLSHSSQANHDFRLSHSSQSQSQALTPKPITISGSHTSPAIYSTYCSFRSPLR